MHMKIIIIINDIHDPDNIKCRKYVIKCYKNSSEAHVSDIRLESWKSCDFFINRKRESKVITTV